MCFLGEAKLRRVRLREEVEVIYRYSQDPDTFQGHLEILPKDPDSPIKPYSYYPAVGGEHFISITSVEMGSILGDLIRVDWGWGASTLGMTLYAINPHDEIVPFFRDGSRAGCEIRRLKDTPTPQIIIGRRLDPVDSGWMMDVFDYDLESRCFLLKSQHFAQEPHHYKLIP